MITLILLGTTLFLIVSLALILNLIMNKGLDEVEYQREMVTLERVPRAIDARLEILNHIAIDWGNWDDTYNFIKNPSPDYVKSNLNAESFAQLKVNILIIADLNGSMVYKSHYYNGVLSNNTPELEEYFSEGINYFHATGYFTDRGIILLPKYPLLVVSRPVLRSDGVGPNDGHIIFGRYLDLEETSYISDFVGYPVEIMRYDVVVPDDFNEAKLFFSNNNSLLVKNINETTSFGYVLIMDGYNQPALIVKVIIDRTAHKQGRIIQRYLWASVIISCLVMMIIMRTLLSLTLLRKIKKIYTTIEYVRAKDDLSKRIDVKSKCEIGLLANNLNAMITSLESSRAKLVQESEEIAKANAELKKIDVMKDDFISNVSHELRSPLATIKAYTQMMDNGDLGKINKYQKEGVGIILSSSNQLQNLISELLDISRLESSNARFQFSRQKLRPIIDEVIFEFRPGLRKVKGRVVNQVSKYCSLDIDRDRVKQVFRNLMDNAIKYMSKRPLLITISSRKAADGNCEILFSDNGVGIKPENMVFLFSKFYQVNQGLNKAAESGVGLGLSIVKEILKAHGAEITAESDYGKGTTFRIVFPPARPELVND